MDKPSTIDDARRVKNENENANINMHTPAISVPQIIWGGLPCRSENRPRTGLDTAIVMIGEEIHIPISHVLSPTLIPLRGRNVSKIP